MSELLSTTPSGGGSRYDELCNDLLARLAGESPQLRKIGVGISCPWTDDSESWLSHLFPEAVSAGFGPHHREIWAWAWALRRSSRPRPFVAIWPRGGGKSSTAELICIAAGALGLRRYALYVSATQDLADKHVSDIARRLESEALERYYPALAAREVSKYGISRGWSGSRLRTAAGFMVDAIGLNAAVRGLKVGDSRPDLIILDDVDELADSPETVAGKIATITQSVLLAGSTDLAVLAVQNLIHPASIFSRLAGVSEHTIDMLADRIVSGPYPAILDMVTEQQGHRTVITGGTPLWAGQGIKECQDAIDTVGITAFNRESQQETEPPPGGMFNHIDFRHCDRSAVPDLVRIVVWVDPAVTDKDSSDSHGIQIDGIAADNTIYRLWSWEQRAGPRKALLTAILKAHEFGALAVGVETDQGGDTWQELYTALVKELRSDEGAMLEDVTYRLPKGARPPVFRSDKAGAGHGSKTHRASQMLSDYEGGRFVHVVGTHQAIERALKRFPKTKPFDLVDAAFWCWHDLAGGDGLPYRYLREDPKFRKQVLGDKPELTDAERIEARRAAYYEN